MKTFELYISETGRANLSEEAHCFNNEIKSFATLDALKTFLIKRYGRMPNGRKKIFRDILLPDGTQTAEVTGFLHSYWNSDCSHMWYQTDWIEVFEQETIRNYKVSLK